MADRQHCSSVKLCHRKEGRVKNKTCTGKLNQIMILIRVSRCTKIQPVTRMRSQSDSVMSAHPTRHSTHVHIYSPVLPGKNR